MNMENCELVADEPVQFQKWPVEVQDYRNFTDLFRKIYRTYLKLIIQNPEDDHNV